MNKFWKYLYGILLALRGKYPYDELEHLEFIRVHIQSDDRWLCVIPAIRPLVERHAAITGKDWRSTSFKEISNFREDIALILHGDAATRLGPFNNTPRE